MTVTQPTQGVFRVHLNEGPRDFEVLDDALDHARDVAVVVARERARLAGAPDPVLSIDTEENRVDHDIDGSVFFEATVCATATGTPSS